MALKNTNLIFGLRTNQKTILIHLEDDVVSLFMSKIQNGSIAIDGNLYKKITNNQPFKYFKEIRLDFHDKVYPGNNVNVIALFKKNDPGVFFEKEIKFQIMVTKEGLKYSLENLSDIYSTILSDLELRSEFSSTPQSSLNSYVSSA